MRAALGLTLPAPALPRPSRAATFLLAAAAVAAVTLWLARARPWARRLPADALPPLRRWLTEAFAWAANDADLGLFTVRELTRALAAALAVPLAWSEGLLSRGFPGLGVPPVPWPAVALAAAALGWRLGGRRLAALAGGGALYLALFGVWAPAMQTLSLVLVAAPLAALAGLALGVAASRSARAEGAVAVACDVLQSVPHLAYLGPVIVFFGFGQVPALVATALFAMPPMARCALLGVRTTPREAVEAARMAGCSDLQLLLKVELPIARPTLLVGLNQAIMQSLAMVVITSLIGAVGLGQRLLFALQQLRVGEAVEIGVAVVVLAVALDRLSQAWARRAAAGPAARDPAGAGPLPRALWLALAAAAAALWAASPALPWLGAPPPGWTVTTAPLWDAVVRWVAVHLFGPLKILRDGLTVGVLIPWRNVVLALPWTTAVGVVAVLGWAIGGPRLAVRAGAPVAFVALAGLWGPALLTVYLVSIAAALAALIGVPLGILAAESRRGARAAAVACDTLETFPSFVYLIPVVMLFRVGDLANILAIVGVAAVPAVRYTQLGLARVPAALIEAAAAAGATRGQVLRKVKLPLALPEIALGLNQVIMTALVMTSITALIGSRDLGQEILKALPEGDTGRGLLAGLSIAALGMAADRPLAAWARGRDRLGPARA